MGKNRDSLTYRGMSYIYPADSGTKYIGEIRIMTSENMIMDNEIEKTGDTDRIRATLQNAFTRRL